MIRHLSSVFLYRKLAIGFYSELGGRVHNVTVTYPLVISLRYGTWPISRCIYLFNQKKTMGFPVHLCELSNHFLKAQSASKSKGCSCARKAKSPPEKIKSSWISCEHVRIVHITSSTAQGGGGRWLDLCLLEWLRWLQWSPHPQLLDVVWCTAAVVVIVA